MIYPHIEKDNKIQRAEAWVVCNRCNNSRHRVLPGERTPYWWCQDEKQELREGQEIEVEYLEP